MTDRQFSVFTGLALAGALLSLVLLAARFASAISISEPLQLQTSGDEFSSHFAIWRHIQGLPVYTDRFSPPFSFSIYNWLFYDSYGRLTAAVLGVLSLGEPWIPTIGRLISLAAMVVGMVAAHLAFVRAAAAMNQKSQLLCLAFAVLVMAGPLVGFWNVTVRSDLWARTFEAVAVAAFLAEYPRRRWAAVLWAVPFAYFAWAFKQGNVFAAGAIGLFLLVRRDWKSLAMLAILLPALWGATLFFGEPQYVYNVLLRDVPYLGGAGHMFRNLVNFGVKTGPMLFLLAGVLVVVLVDRKRRAALWRRDAFVLGVAGSLCAAVLTLPASSYRGGAENYYFTLSFFMALAAVASLPVMLATNDTARSRVLTAGSAGWATLIVAIGLVLAGTVGVVDVRPQHVANMQKKRCLDGLPRPLFVDSPLLSLPWMTPGNEPWVISYVYEDDRRAGHAFKEGGVGGLIAKGRFNVMALQKSGRGSPAAFDGASLSDYRLVDDAEAARRGCPDFYLFFKKS